LQLHPHQQGCTSARRELRKSTDPNHSMPRHQLSGRRASSGKHSGHSGLQHNPPCNSPTSPGAKHSKDTIPNQLNTQTHRLLPCSTLSVHSLCWCTTHDLHSLYMKTKAVCAWPLRYKLFTSCSYPHTMLPSQVVTVLCQAKCCAAVSEKPDKQLACCTGARQM
jgi:hypothetical protein